MCKESHASKNYAKLFELVQVGAGKEGGRGVIAETALAERVEGMADLAGHMAKEYLEQVLFDFRGKVVLDLGVAKGWTEFAAFSAARRVVSIDGTDRVLPPSIVSAASSKVVITRVKWRVKDMIMALSCPPGDERSACLDVVQDALSDASNPRGSADVVLGDLACNVRECGKLLSALALLLGGRPGDGDGTGDCGGGRRGLIVITVIGSAIGADAMAQIWASGARRVSLVHLFASRKQERCLVAHF